MRRSLAIAIATTIMIVSLWGTYVTVSFAVFGVANQNFLVVLPGDGYSCLRQAHGIHIGPMYVSSDMGESGIREPGFPFPQTFNAYGRNIDMGINRFDLGYGLILGESCIKINPDQGPDVQRTMNRPTLGGFVFSYKSSRRTRLIR